MFGEEVEDRGDFTGRVPQGTVQGVQVLVLEKSQEKLGTVPFGFRVWTKRIP